MRAAIVDNSTDVVINVVEVDPNSLDSWDVPAGCYLELDSTRGVGDNLLPKTISYFVECIDTAATYIYARWTRFETEYAERENAARSLIANPEVIPSVYVTSFAQASGKTNQEAAQIIVAQADALRAALAQIAAIRMRKYELYSAAPEDRQALTDKIIQQMQAVAEALT